MAKGFKHGTSGKKENPLNFAVVAYPSEVELNTAIPEDTNITTVGVVTTNPINGWFFSPEQPSDMAEGEVWFKSGTSSTVEFNALKENSVMVYPLSAKQMVSGALKDVIAKSYQKGKWVDWLPSGALYWDGVQCVKWVEMENIITSGWVKKSPVFGKDNILLTTGTTNNDDWFCGMVTDEKHDITEHTKLIVEIEGAATVYVGSDLNVCITSSKAENWSHNNSIAFKQYTADVPNIIEVPFNTSGSYYIIVFLIRRAQATIKRIYLE